MLKATEIGERRGLRDTSQIRVPVAYDHAMVREGMAEMLSLNEDIEILGQAGDCREAVELAKETRSDVVILDVEMPGWELRRLLELSPPKVVIVTVFANQRLVRQLLGLGTSAFLTKNASSQDLAATVRSITHVSPGDPDNVTITMSREDFDAEETAESELSRRELQILRLAARGMGNKEVANILHLSETTIKRNLSNVYGKLDVNSRGEAVSKAVSEGQISSWDIAKDEQPCPP